MSKEKQKSEKSLLQFNLKSLLVVLVLAIGLYFLVPRLLNEKHVVSLLLQAKKSFLLLALLSEVVSYIGAAAVMGVILSRLGYQISFKDRFRLGSIAAFAIHFFPVSGLGEGAVDYYFLRRRKVNAGSVVLMFALRSIITYSAFLLLFIFSLALVPVFPDLSFSPRTISLILFALILAGILYLVLLYKNKEKFHKTVIKLTHFANIILRFFRRATVDESKITEVYNDIYEGIGLFAKQKRSSLKAVAFAMIYWLGDILCLFFVFLSLDHKVNLSILISGYCISTLIGQISLIPGGLGITEGSMSLIFSGVGIPFSLAITAVLIFRFFSFWIWIPIGLISYITLRNGNSKMLK